MRGGTRRALTVGLVLLTAVLILLGMLIAWLLVQRGAGLDTAVVLAIFLAFSALTLMWVLFTLLDGHFDDLERLRGDVLISSGLSSLPRDWRAASDAGAEVRRLGDSVGQALARLHGVGNEPEQRLQAVVGAAAEGLIVVTESGLVSLINSAALAALGQTALGVGHSVFAAFERDDLIEAEAQAEQAGVPVEMILRTLDGRRLTARVVELNAGGGLVISLPGAGLETAGGGEREAALYCDLSLHDQPPLAEAPVDSTPLAELPVVVLDCETTGLDVEVDRIVSLGAVRLHGRRIYKHVYLDRLFHPGQPIPARASAVHGITDKMVEGAQGIGEGFSDILGFIENCVVIGHSIGFDLALLRREAKRAGVSWREPPVLDTALLSAALHPEMKAVDLEFIAERYGVNVEGRHTALGDCLVTAEVYLCLAAALADRDVVSFGQARDFALKAKHLLRQQQAAGWHETPSSRTGTHGRAN